MPSLSLRKSKPVDANGQPLDPARLYQPVSPYATADHEVYGERVELPGDHPAVLAIPTRWTA